MIYKLQQKAIKMNEHSRKSKIVEKNILKLKYEMICESVLFWLEQWSMMMIIFLFLSYL